MDYAKPRTHEERFVNPQVHAPLGSRGEFISEEVLVERKRSRRRCHVNGEPVLQTALQRRYQRQLRYGQEFCNDWGQELTKLVAWTWIPGKNRRECSPIVDLRDSRLLVMDRFPDESEINSPRIGLSMYRPSVQHNGRVVYAGPNNIELFKDFSIRPHFKAGGLALDSTNEEVFRTALTLEREIKLVAKGKVAPVDSFDPPQVLLGFPYHYLPMPEWRAPMQDVIRQLFHPDSNTLEYLLSPGGTIVDIFDMRNGYRTISFDKNGERLLIRIPTWLKVPEYVYPGAHVGERLPLADLPRKEYKHVNEVTAVFPFGTLEWIEKRILEERTELLEIEENVYDKRTGTHHRQMMMWRIIPAQFVQTQTNRSVRAYIDFRKHLGRVNYTIDALEYEVCKEDSNQVKVCVMQFPERPLIADCQFCDNIDVQDATWTADLMTMPVNAVWANRCALRGNL